MSLSVSVVSVLKLYIEPVLNHRTVELLVVSSQAAAWMFGRPASLAQILLHDRDNTAPWWTLFQIHFEMITSLYMGQ